jgi:hypothetical protein
MTLLGHFIAADIRRLRAPIAAWVAVAIAGLVLQALLPSFDQSPDRARALGLTATLLTSADYLLMLALIASVVQTHSLVGSDAFWMTRPVRRDVLLASKLALLAGLLVGLRVAGEVIHMAAYDVPAADIAAGAAHVALFRTLGVLVIMIAAAVTPNLARFALVCGVLLLAAATATAFASVFANPVVRYGIRVYEPGEALASIARERTYTRLVAAAVVGVAAAIAVLAVQYRWRMLRRTVPALVTGVLLVPLVGSLRIWPVPAGHVSAPAWTNEPGAARLEAESPSIAFKPLRYGRDEHGWLLGWMRVGVSGVPRGWIATVRLAGGTLEASGVRLNSPGHAGDRVLAFADRNTEEASVPATLRDVLGVRRYGVASNGFVGGPGALVAFVGGTAEISLHQGKSVDYAGDFVLTLTRIDVAAVLPIEVGATFTDGAHRVRVERLEPEGNGLRMYVRTSDVRTLFTRTPRPVYYYFLRNRRLSEAAEADVYRNRAVLASLYPRASPLEVSTSEMFFSRMVRWPNAGQFRLDDEWIKDAELVIVRTIADGMLTRTLTMTGVELSIEPKPSR